MSVKYFCDLCKEELKPNEGERSSSFKYYQKAFSFIKHQKQEGTQEITQLLCGNCTDKVKKAIEEISMGEIEITKIEKK